MGIKKKLYRSRTNKVFGGLIGGLGEYFDIDPVLLRVLFLFAIFMTGFFPGLIAYIIGLFIVPKYNPSAHEEK